MRAVENLPRDPRTKLSHDIKKFSRGSCKVRWRSRHSTRKESFLKGEKDYRKIIDKILETGGDRISGYFPAKRTELADKFRVSGKTAKNVWQKFVHDGTASPRKESRGIHRN